jgi:ferredoxin
MTVSPVPPAFVFDPNTCVGCQACAIACVNENRLTPGHFWRQVVTFNAERRPQRPTYHLSLACNHCLDAPCVRACPARAIARDARTGAVLIHVDYKHFDFLPVVDYIGRMAHSSPRDLRDMDQAFHTAHIDEHTEIGDVCNRPVDAITGVQAVQDVVAASGLGKSSSL